MNRIGSYRLFGKIRLLALALVVLSGWKPLAAQDLGEPLLRLEAGGPTSYVTALAFGPGGRTLYAGSWDKTVRVWRLDPRGQFQLEPAAWRVPIGPGLDGAINTIAVSEDGNWLAAAGKAVIEGAADFRRPGRILPTVGGLTDTMRLDEGTIYVFDTRTRTTYTLRGHRGEVRALAFAPSTAGGPLLVSAAREWDEKSGRYSGGVRAWNVTKPEPLVASQTLPELRYDTWPKLAVQRADKNRLGVNVAIAWGDGTFRTWDLQRNRLNVVARQGQFNDTVVYDATNGRFIAGSLGDDGSARWRAWSMNAGVPQQDAARTVELAKAGQAITAPRGLALLSDRIASVMHRHYSADADNQDQYELWLSAPQRGAKIQALALWKAGPPPRRVPTIASAPQGEHLAVTRGPDIYVYAINKLLAGTTQPQILRSVGASFRELAFVRNKAGNLGLALREELAAGQVGLQRLEASDLVFDLATSKIKGFDAADAWRLAPPAARRWRVETRMSAGATPHVQVVLQRDGQPQPSVIDLEAGHEVTDYALAADAQPPVIALATHHFGLPSLQLYDALTGELVRQLTAHSGLIRALAFSDDGKLLASTADDQTVCFWRLTDLEKIVGQRGLAAGIAVREDGEKIVVQVDKNVAIPGELVDGDTLLGQVVGEKLMPWKSPREFYDAFWNSKPGAKIVVRRERAGATRDVTVLASQGADERKPLLSLFVTREEEGKARSWIGWSPLGPYQASDEGVEQNLGWHFNTGRKEAPVGFARAGQYREKYFRPGLIEALIKTGVAPEDKQATAPLPKPALDLVFDGDFQTLPTGALLLRTLPNNACLVLPGLPPEKIASVELRVDDKAMAGATRQTDGNTWSAPIMSDDWKPGEHLLKATVTTLEARPQKFTIERTVRYQLLPPSIELATRGGPGGLVAERSNFTFAAKVLPGAAGSATLVTLSQVQGKESKIVREWNTKEPLDIKESIELTPGSNVLELTARNQTALTGFEAAETTVERLAVNYSEMEKLPTLADVKVLPLDEGQVLPSVDVADAPTVVTVDKIQLAGEISGASGNLEIESSLGGPAAPLNVAAATADKGAQFSSKEITLQPGVQTIRVRRREAGAPVIETQTRIDFRPPLPNLTVESPLADAVLVDGRDQPQVALRAKLTAVSHRHPFEAKLVINGKVSEVPVKIDAKTNVLTADIPLASGDNLLAVQLANAWNEPKVTKLATIQFLSLPTVERLADLGEVTTSVVDLVISGKSKSALTVVEINRGQPSAMRLPEDAINFDAAKGTWQATVKNWALANEAQELEVLATNLHGTSLLAGKFPLPAWKKPDAPPTIDIASGGNVTSTQFDLQFAVRSQSALASVTILHNEQPIVYPIKLADLKPDAAGWYTLLGSHPIALVPGDNRFLVTASNAGGSVTERTLINYIDPPARVVIDRLESVDLANKVVLPVIVQESRARVITPSPTAKVMVCGRVEWPRSIDPKFLQKWQRLQVWVNGFQQAPVEIAAPKPGTLTSEFTAFVVLNQHQDNHIQISVPDLTPDAATLFDLVADCLAPVTEQRLHLLIVGVGTAPGSESELRAEVLAALKARQAERGLRTAAFDRVAIYGPIVGADISPQQVRTQLNSIKVKIDELYKTNRSSTRPANDVVMLYLQGGSLANSEGDFFITTRPTSDPRTARALRDRESRILMDVGLKSRTLVDFLTYTTGAHVLMLDVSASQEIDEAALWPKTARAAMLRYTWLKDSVAPRKARLLAALPEAIQVSGELKQLDANISKIHSRLASEYPESSNYQRRVPERLEALLLGETVPKVP